MSNTVTLTREELKSLMSEAVVDAFVQMGVDADDPIQMQHDFAHLRRWRIAVDSAQQQTFRVAAGVIVAGFLGAVWLGFKALVHIE